MKSKRQYIFEYILYICIRDEKQKNKTNKRRDEMAFLALNTQREYYIQQQSALEYRQMCASSNLNIVTQKTAALANEYPDAQPNAKLKALQDMYTSQVKSLDTQLTQIKENIKSFEKVVGDNIKSSCKFNFLG